MSNYSYTFQCSDGMRTIAKRGSYFRRFFHPPTVCYVALFTFYLVWHPSISVASHPPSYLINDDDDCDVDDVNGAARGAAAAANNDYANHGVVSVWLYWWQHKHTVHGELGAFLRVVYFFSLPRAFRHSHTHSRTALACAV